MADHLASIYGTEKDKVNCSFYFKIGACRHGDRCSRKHVKPTFSQTILVSNVYQNPAHDSMCTLTEDQLQEHFDLFFEDFFVELAKYGEIEEMNVCDNVGDHLVGNVYVRYRYEEDAQKAVDALNDRFYAGRPLYAELSPVTDFKEACCRQYENSECTRGGLCNFMHLKNVSRKVKKNLFEAQRKSIKMLRQRRSRSRSRDRSRDRGDKDRDRDRRRSRVLILCPGSKSAGKKATKATPSNAADLDSTEKLTKANLEIDVLVRELETKNEQNVRLREQMAEQRMKIEWLEEQLELRSADRIDLTSDMSRQYKSMQAELTSKINGLEVQVADLNGKLVVTQHALQEAKELYSRTIAEKDGAIEDQNLKLTYMSAEFEQMLNETIAKMTKKLELVSQRWKETEQVDMSGENEKRLADFHLKRLTLEKPDC
ncbi:hypothetical protein HK102_006916 [Quaeritorhiza haematococci]|nr:hypothetical protein HK102_006916 [Quaeritorhiza haematococci]